MKQKKLNIVAPEGYEIDKERSTFEKIVFKKVPKKWRDDHFAKVKGFYISNFANIEETLEGIPFTNIPDNYNVFATKRHAKSALAMARISQIMANDERFGGPITDEEWNRRTHKFIIHKYGNKIQCSFVFNHYYFLAFHTIEQRDLFLKENEDLVKNYLMVD